MATALHSESPLGENHIIENWSYADSTARTAATGFTTSDLGKIAYQQSDGTFWRLTATTPTWAQVGGGSGTVTSVAMSVPSFLSVSGSPITTSGTLALSLATQTANRVWAGPTTGSAAAPTFRALVLADLPAGILLTANNLSDIVDAATARTNLGLGGAAILNVGTGSGDVAAGNAPAAAISAHLIASDPHGDRAYTDAQIAAMLTSAFDFKASVLVATTTNITLSGTQTIDGVSVTAGARVLVKNQSTGSQNGIYVCASGSWTRATDADADAEVTAGLAVPVEQGTVNGGRLFMLTTSGTITVGTTALTFTRIDAGDLAAANNLSDLTDVAQARNNLALAAVAASGSASDLTAGTLSIARIADGSVTLAKIANIATARILGRTTAGSGVPEELTAAQAQVVMALDVETTELGAVARSRVRKNSTGTVYKRRQLNLIEGSGITITVADDSGNEETDITIAASGGGGNTATIFSAVADATVGNTTTETTLVNTTGAAGSLSITGNTLAAGDVFHFKGFGYSSNTGGSWLNIRIKFGSTTICYIVSTTIQTTSTTQLFEIDAWVTCRTTGASGTMVGGGSNIRYNGAKGADLYAIHAATVSSPSVTVDTTATASWDITAQHQTANASNTVTIYNLVVTKHKV